MRLLAVIFTSLAFVQASNVSADDENEAGTLRPLLLVTRKYLMPYMPIHEFVSFYYYATNVGEYSAKDVSIGIENHKESTLFHDLFEVKGAIQVVIPRIAPGESVHHVVSVKLRREPRNDDESKLMNSFAVSPAIAIYRSDFGERYVAHSSVNEDSLPRLIHPSTWKKWDTSTTSAYLMMFALMMSPFTLGSLAVALRNQYRYSDEEYLAGRYAKKEKKKTTTASTHDNHHISDRDESNVAGSESPNHYTEEQKKQKGAVTTANVVARKKKPKRE